MGKWNFIQQQGSAKRYFSGRAWIAPATESIPTKKSLCVTVCESGKPGNFVLATSAAWFEDVLLSFAKSQLRISSPSTIRLSSLFLPGCGGNTVLLSFLLLQKGIQLHLEEAAFRWRHL